MTIRHTAINVTGDLVAAKLMDKWGQSLESELAQQEKHETIRNKTCEDVITAP
jgi:Na+/H+-dicarboxylate symporter